MENEICILEKCASGSGFVAKLTFDGKVKWITGFNNISNFYPNIDEQGNVYVISIYNGTIMIGENRLYCDGYDCYFIAKLSDNIISTLGNYTWTDTFNLFEKYFGFYGSGWKSYIEKGTTYKSSMYYHNDSEQEFDSYITLPWGLKYKSDETINPGEGKTLNFKVKFFNNYHR